MSVHLQTFMPMCKGLLLHWGLHNCWPWRHGQRRGPAWQKAFPVGKPHSVNLVAILYTITYAASLEPFPTWVQTCLVTFAYMAAQWPSFLASNPGGGSCSQQSWPQGPRSLWEWLTRWTACRRFDNDYMVLWGARQVSNKTPVPSFLFNAEHCSCCHRHSITTKANLVKLVSCWRLPCFSLA